MWRIFLDRPVFAGMVAGALMVFGVIAYRDLGVATTPKVEIPIITVMTRYPGASPEAVEEGVTRVLEEALAALEGLDRMVSYSMESQSLLILEFTLETKIADALQDVREKVDLARGSLPADAEDPVVQRINLQDMPILQIVVRGEGIPRVVLGEMVRRQLIPLLERVPGVGRVEAVGVPERAFQVFADAERMAEFGVAWQELLQVLAGEHGEWPGGILRAENSAGVRVRKKWKSAEEIAETVLRSTEDGAIRVADVAEVVDGRREMESLAFWEEEPAIVLQIIKRTGANEVRVADRVKAFLRERAPAVLPEGVQAEVLLDSTLFIRGSLEETRRTLYAGAVLAILAVLFFLRSWRGTLVLAIAIPTSLISAFMLLRWADFTLNILTLMALAVAAGMVVDNGIVVLENFTRHLERSDPRTAADRGTQEVWQAILASTLTTLAVFGPIAFMRGIMGRFFREFGLTVAFAIVISLLVSISLTPAFCAFWMRKEQPKNPVRRLTALYRVALARAITRPGLVVLVAFLFFLTVPWGFRVVGKSLIPPLDTGELSIEVQMPPGTPLRETASFARALARDLKRIPEVRTVVVSAGGTAVRGGALARGITGDRVAQIFVRLEERPPRKRSSYEILREIEREIFPRFAGAERLEAAESRMAMGGTRPISLSIQGPSRELLRPWVRRIREIVEQTPGTRNVVDNLPKGNPEWVFRPDPVRTREYGLRAQDVALLLRTWIHGMRVAEVYLGGQVIPVRVRLKPEQRALDRLPELPMLTPRGLVYLQQMGRFVPGESPSVLYRLDRFPAYLVEADLDPEVPLGSALQSLREDIRKLGLPPAVRLDFGLQAKRFREMMENFLFAFSLGAILIYMVLAAQFNSLLQPLIIMLAIPLDLIGAIWALVLTGTDFSITSGIGILMLSGIVVNQSILLVDFINQHRARGLPLREAILEGSALRFRPILMTQVTTILGVLPAALLTGKGAEFRTPLAIAFLGGMVVSTLLTLFVVPAIYALVTRK